MEELDLAPFFNTHAQAVDFTTKLAAIESKIYETTFDLDKIALQQFGIMKKDKFIALLRNSRIDTSSSAFLKDFLAKLQKYVTELPTLTLVVAFEPDQKTMEIISEWFLLNLKKHVLFEFKIQKEMIAGAQINFNGKFLDCSLKEKVEQAIIKLSGNSTPQPTIAQLQQAPIHQSVENIHT